MSKITDKYFYQSETRKLPTVESKDFVGSLYTIDSIAVDTYDKLYASSAVLMYVGDNKVANKILEEGYKTFNVNEKDEELNVMTVA